MRIRKLFLMLIASNLLLAGCGGVQKKPQRKATGDVALGHELLRKRDLDGALAEFLAVLERESTPESEFRVGCALYLKGDVDEAKSAFESYLQRKPDAPKWDRDEVTAEIKRMEEKPSDDDEHAENSMAGRRLRAEYLLLEAEAALSSNDFAKAAKNYQDAAKVMPNPELWFEAALLSTKAGDYASARKQYRAFLTESREGLDERLAFGVQAEIFRLEALIEGKKPTSGKSLADRVFEARERGEEFKIDDPSESAPPAEESASASAPENPEAEAKAGEPEEAAPPLTAKERKALERKAKAEERKAKAEEKERKRKERRAKIREEKERKRAEARAKEEERKRKRAERRAQKQGKGKKEVAIISVLPEQTAGAESAGSDESPYAESSGAAAAEQAAPESASASAQPTQSSPSLEALISYCDSSSSAVRIKAVKELTSIPDPRATRALEKRVLTDSSIQVRLAATDALVARNATESIPVLRRASLTSSNSNERATLQRAIRRLSGTDRIKDVMPDEEQ